MFERFTNHARAIVAAGEREARDAGSDLIEAEHLLLAISALADDEAGRALIDLGLDHGRLRDLLDQERARSLAYAGVDPTAYPAPAAAPTRARSNRFATSAKAVLQRAVRGTAARGGRSIDSTDLLVAVLEAETGTVPRMVGLADLDRAAMLARLGEGRGR